MNKFGFWDSEFDLSGPSFGPDDPECPLEDPYVCSIGERRRREAKVVHVGECDTIGNIDVEGRNVQHEEPRGDRRALACADLDWGEDSRGALKQQATGALGEEGLDPRQ